jgi:hypothetical protein
VVTQRALIPPDERPDPYNPGNPDPRFLPAPQQRAIRVEMNYRPLMTAVNDAIHAGDKERVTLLFKTAKISVEEKADNYLVVTMTPRGQ